MNDTMPRSRDDKGDESSREANTSLNQSSQSSTPSQPHVERSGQASEESTADPNQNWKPDAEEQATFTTDSALAGVPVDEDSTHEQPRSTKSEVM